MRGFLDEIDRKEICEKFNAIDAVACKLALAGFLQGYSGLFVGANFFAGKTE